MSEIGSDEERSINVPKDEVVEVVEYEKGWLPVMKFAPNRAPGEITKISWIFSPSGRYAVNLGYGLSASEFPILDVLETDANKKCGRYENKHGLPRNTHIIAMYWLSDDVFVFVNYDNHQLKQHMYRLNHVDKIAEAYFSRVYTMRGDFKPGSYYEFNVSPLEIGTEEFLLLWDDDRAMFCLFPFNPLVGNQVDARFFIYTPTIEEGTESVFGPGWKLSLHNSFCLGKKVIVTMYNTAHGDDDEMRMTALNMFMIFSVDPKLLGSDHDEPIVEDAVMVRGNISTVTSGYMPIVMADCGQRGVALMKSAKFYNSGSKLVIWKESTSAGMQPIAVIDFYPNGKGMEFSFARTAFKMDSSVTLDPFGHLQVWSLVGSELFCREQISMDRAMPPSLFQLCRDKVLYNMRHYPDVKDYKNVIFPR